MPIFQDNSQLQSNTYFVFTYPDLRIVEGDGASHNEADQRSKILPRPKGDGTKVKGKYLTHTERKDENRCKYE